MKLKISNIGKVVEADIDIKGITVIAGENNTGKSTVGKVLFSVFQTYYDLKNKIFRERFNSLKDLLDDGMVYEYIRRTPELSFQKFHLALDENIERLIFLFDENQDRFSLEKDKFLLDIYKDDISNKVDEIVERLQISSKLLLQNILTRTFREEFNKQINYLFNDSKGEVILGIKHKNLSFDIESNQVRLSDSSFDLSTEVCYIDNPLIVDDRENWFIFESDITLHHSDYLRKQFRKSDENNTLEQVLADERLKSVNDIFSSIYNWQVVSENRMGVDFEKKVDFKNLSSGLKSFYILKKLIENGTIKNRSTIILDEPEVHLHPEWQVLYAEILVILQKELNLHLLINTHSPYFMNAIEVFSEKHDIVERCSYYLADNGDDGRSVIENVTENTSKIYQKLSRPLQILENIRYADND